ncbi:MAG: tRNA pseudouridine(38-40) synthase TruA [Gammaproteobacteria bacterium]
MRIAIGIEYDGTHYHGWQNQHELPTIQTCLEQALSKIANQTITTTCAGRTDAGVHAAGQIVHFDTDVLRNEQAWVFGASRYLPAAIRVRWARQVPDDFHARYSAITRRYHYVIYNHPQRPVWQRHGVTWCYLPLDENRMAQAAGYLLGEHDFSSFRGADCQSKTPRRNLLRLSVIRHGDYLLLDVKANSFLHHMVRNIAGVLLMIGSAKKTPEWAQEVLEARQRTAAGVTAAPYGLYLMEVEYPKIYSFPKLSGDHLWFGNSLTENAS